MLPSIIVIDKSGPYTGADIHKNYIVVRPRQKHKVIQGLRMFMPNVDFKIMSKQEYLNEIKTQKNKNEAS